MSLKRILGETFKWNKARLDCLSCLLLALFAVRTVNLSEIEVAFTSKAEVSSRYLFDPISIDQKAFL